MGGYCHSVSMTASLKIFVFLFLFFPFFNATVIQEWPDLKSGLGEKVSVTLLKLSRGYSVLIRIGKKCGTSKAGLKLMSTPLTSPLIMISSMTALLKVFKNPADIKMVMTNKIGPDEIIVQLEGNTLQTQIAHSTNLCSEYNALFQLPLGGVHALKVSYPDYSISHGIICYL